MKVAVQHRCDDFSSYRAARVKSLFNVESGANFQIEADLDLDSAPWQIGVIVGPSGSGKTSMGRALWGQSAVYTPAWPDGQPIIDAITPGGFDDVTAALSSVGPGSVPTWLRPYSVLSNGEQFRANLARLIAEAPGQAVLDEFSSVVDRQACPHWSGRICQSLAPHQRPGRALERRSMTSSTGCSPIGYSTLPQASFNGGGFGDGRASTSGYGSAAGSIGQP